MENSKCSHPDCELEVYENHDKCVLHCKKNDYSTDFNSGLLNKFYQELKKSIIVDLTKNQKNLQDAFFQEMIYDIENDDFSNIDKENKYFFLSCYIIFPDRDSRDNFDYLKLLNIYSKIHFKYCEFHTSHIDLNSTKCFFQNCKFHKYWTLFDYNILTNMDNIIYQACIFYEDISPYSSEIIGEEVLYTNSQFDYTCRFEKELRFDNVKFKKPLFYSAQNNYLNNKNYVKVLTFNNCTFEQPFRLNNYQIDYFTCNDTVFKNKSKFEFKKNKVEYFLISNTNFKALVDCYNTTFEKFYIEKSIFEKFTGFEKCKFGENHKNNLAIFQYATFLDFINFRDAVFYNGLDLRNANLKEYPNFLGVKIEPTIIHKKTDKETFRIIKYSFDKVGNTIEANKFFAYEMDKERKSISLWHEADKKIILTFNYLVSNFGQSFLLPLFWIFVVAGIHYYIADVKHEWLHPFAPTDLDTKRKLLEIIQGFDNFAKNILPFKKFLQEGMEFISLIFLIIYSTLIYNFVIAVKRITKR